MSKFIIGVIVGMAISVSTNRKIEVLKTGGETVLRSLSNRGQTSVRKPVKR